MLFCRAVLFGGRSEPILHLAGTERQARWWLLPLITVGLLEPKCYFR